jgi:four helix bundle protein
MRTPLAQGFADLEVYQIALTAAQQVFEVTKGFPREERYSLTGQIRRSSRSVGAQIAEAWVKRRYVRHFVSKITDADAEVQETQHWLEIARRCGYLDDEETSRLKTEFASIGRMLQSMIGKARSFCRP